LTKTRSFGSTFTPTGAGLGPATELASGSNSCSGARGVAAAGSAERFCGVAAAGPAERFCGIGLSATASRASAGGLELGAGAPEVSKACIASPIWGARGSFT
jgi:hypothetical protein